MESDGERYEKRGKRLSELQGTDTALMIAVGAVKELLERVDQLEYEVYKLKGGGQTYHDWTLENYRIRR